MDITVSLLPPPSNQSPSSLLNGGSSELLQGPSGLLSASDIDSASAAAALHLASRSEDDPAASLVRESNNGNELSYGQSRESLADRLGPAQFLVKNEISEHERLLSGHHASNQQPQSSSLQNFVSNQTVGGGLHNDSSLMQQLSHHPVSSLHHMHPHLMNSLHMHHSHLFGGTTEMSGGGSTDPRIHYGTGMQSASSVPTDCMSTQKAVAFLAGPRERIHVLGNPVEHCPRCQQEGLGTTNWRPHRHIGELKIRYICERHFDDLESNHHFDIPLCPICNQVLYLYDFNNMLGVSNARRLHKYVLKCANRHVLPLLDLFCQTKKGGERCNANFKLQWCYGTMVKRCEAQKNRDHDLWWVRYKNEWKQRRTIIRYKKDFLSHLTDAQRSLLLGLGLEGEPPPDPKSALGPTFDALVSSVGGSPNGPKIRKRVIERAGLGQLDGRLGGMGLDGYEITSSKQRFRSSGDFTTSLPDYSNGQGASRLSQQVLGNMGRSDTLSSDSGRIEDPNADPLRYVMGAVVLPSRTAADDPNQLMVYLNQQQQQSAPPTLASHHQSLNFNQTSNMGFASDQFNNNNSNLPSHMIVTGTPTPPLLSKGVSPVAVSVVGDVVSTASGGA